MTARPAQLLTSCELISMDCPVDRDRLMIESTKEIERERSMKRVIRDLEVEMRRLVQLLVRDSKSNPK